MKKKFEAFDWFAQDIDGHDIEAIDEAILKAKEEKEKPSVIVLNTQKGHGWSEIAGKLNGHCPNVSEETEKRSDSGNESRIRQDQGGGLRWKQK